MRNPNHKYYVASPNVVSDVKGWRHRTVDAAVTQGVRMIERGEQSEVLIVKVVRVLRKKPTPVEVEVVK